MKVLFTLIPGVGHLHPVLPLARALQQAGHNVTFATAPSFCPMITAAGFRCWPAGADWQEILGGHAPPAARPPSTATDHAPSGSLPAVAGRMAERMLPDLLTLFKGWRPDVIVRDTWEFAGYLAGELLSVPYVTLGIGLLMPIKLIQNMVGEKLAELRAAHHLAPDPQLDRLHHYLYLSFAPPSYQVPGATATVPTLHCIRPVIEDRTSDEQLPGWVETLPARPTVYATLGTVFNHASHLFGTILAELRDQPLNLILTVGRNQDPAQFGAPPENVHIERYIPLTLLLPHCDAIITHGGFNTVMTALSNGLPLVVIPIAADQPFHAQRCAELGVGIALRSSELGPSVIRDAVRALLEQPSYRERARQLQHEIAALPGPEYAVELLERLAKERQPLIVEGAQPVP